MLVPVPTIVTNLDLEVLDLPGPNCEAEELEENVIHVVRSIVNGQITVQVNGVVVAVFEEDGTPMVPTLCCETDGFGRILKIAGE